MSNYVDYITYGEHVLSSVGGPASRSLNSTLYRLLEDRVGPVQVRQPGEPAAGVAARYDPSRRLHRSSWAAMGEYYAVDCPYCGDNRKRLYVHHLWCTLDDYSGERLRHLAYCFNEGCLRRNYRDFEATVFEWRNSSGGRYPLMRVRAVEVDDVPAGPVELPGECVPLAESADACRYLRGRSFDPAALAEDWGVVHCRRASEPLRAASGRIMVPYTSGGELVGWQGRHVGERDWREPGPPKYFTMPGFHKGRHLYNFDRAKASRALVLVEGVADAWRVGPEAGVALLGKTVSTAQHDLLRAWRAMHSPRKALLILLLDPDAFAHADPDKHAKLQEKRTMLLSALATDLGSRRVVAVDLPPGVDPGRLGTAVLWAEIDRACGVAGVQLSRYRGR